MQNCWEFNKCGRELGGANVNNLGVCPAATDTTFNGMNGGVNGGRYCWRVAGTFCGGKVQGTYARKFANCIDCDFFKRVELELIAAEFPHCLRLKDE